MAYISIFIEKTKQKFYGGEVLSIQNISRGTAAMYAMNFAQVGANIQKELGKKSMTQQSLADALSISKQVMRKIIKGAKAIDVSELTQIASVLGITADALLTMNMSDSPVESMAFMGTIQDEKNREKVELIQSAIDEIQLLEELAHV